MSKHTRAPWVRVRINGHWHIAGYDGRLEVATVTALMDKEQSEANAKLIEATPEMLEACEFAEKYLGPNDPSDGAKCWEAHQKLVAAIKKAKGE